MELSRARAAGSLIGLRGAFMSNDDTDLAHVAPDAAEHREAAARSLERFLAAAETGVKLDCLDLLPVQVEVEPQKGEPLACVQRARHRMREDHGFEVHAQEKLAESIDKTLGVLERRGPVAERPAPTRYGLVRGLLVRSPCSPDHFFDGQSPMYWLALPHRATDPEAFNGRPHAAYASLFRYDQMLYALGDRPLGRSGSPGALPCGDTRDSLEHLTAGLKDSDDQ